MDCEFFAQGTLTPSETIFRTIARLKNGPSFIAAPNRSRQMSFWLVNRNRGCSRCDFDDSLCESAENAGKRRLVRHRHIDHHDKPTRWDRLRWCDFHGETSFFSAGNDQMRPILPTLQGGWRRIIHPGVWRYHPEVDFQRLSKVIEYHQLKLDFLPSRSCLFIGVTSHPELIHAKMGVAPRQNFFQ